MYALFILHFFLYYFFSILYLKRTNFMIIPFLLSKNNPPTGKKLLFHQYSFSKSNFEK